MRRFIMYFLVVSTAIDVLLSYFMFRGFGIGGEWLEINPITRFFILRFGWETTFFLILPTHFLICFFILGLGLCNQMKWVYERLKVWYWLMIVAKGVVIIFWMIFLFKFFHYQ